MVREGSNVTLRCAAAGLPTPNITWRREDGESILLGDGQEGKEYRLKFISNKDKKNCQRYNYKFN